MWDEPNVELRCLRVILSRTQKGCRFIETARRWPRKSESAKECVTTHLPNESVPKMDGAQVLCYDDTDTSLLTQILSEVLTSRRKREGYTLGSFSGETHWGTAFSADLGGSSKYSSGCGSLRTEVEKGFILIAIIYE